MPDSDRIPVTVLTGFLGAGKTTLLNHILTGQHGRRIAVIENEFGEIGIDDRLVIQAEEEIFEMNNGCICCTVRGDLIRILGNLMRRRDRFDHILVETTGLADPAPVAQTFFVDSDMRANFRLDGVVTLIDAKHILQHIDEAPEAKEQIAFADVILLNKTDLVETAELDRLEARIHGINAMARVHRTTRAKIDLAAVLDVGGFDLSRALEVKPTFLEPEYPFEWAGAFTCAAGPHRLRCTGDGSDADVAIAVLAISSAADLRLAAEQAVAADLRAAPRLRPGNTIVPGVAWHRVPLEPAGQTIDLGLDLAAGTYAILCEHRPDEVGLTLLAGDRQVDPVAEVGFAGHDHDAEVTSVGIEESAPIDLAKLNAWLGALLRERGVDLFRTKGIINIAGDDRRLVFQGVHMLFDAQPDRPWTGPRLSQLVFIGRNLDREELVEGFRACRA